MRSFLMSITCVGKVQYCWKGILFPFHLFSSYKLASHKSFMAFLSLVTWNSFLKYAWNYFASSVFIDQWNTEHKSLSGNVIFSTHIAFNWSACPGYLVQVGRLKNMGLPSSLSDPLSAANILEIFLNHLLSSARSLFYLGSSFITIPKNKLSFFLALTFTGVCSHWASWDGSLYNPVDVSYYCT